MQDRIPLYPGRVKMTPVAGQANTFDMVRADDPTQAGTPLNKATFLKDATAALYGLGTGAVPDDVLAELGKYKQYWWRRRLPAFNGYAEKRREIESGDDAYISTGQGETNYIYYSKSINIDQSTGTVTLDNPSRVSIGYREYTLPGNCQEVCNQAPCYIRFNTIPKIFYLPAGATYAQDTTLTDTSPETMEWYTNGSDSGNITLRNTSYTNPKALRVISEKVDRDVGDWEYLQSSTRSAYPDSGMQDGYEYEYLGIPFDNAVTAPKIETGSYVGTGTYGQANPNTLTFGFVPKFVWIYAWVRGSYWYNTSSNSEVAVIPFDVIPQGEFGRHYPPFASSNSGGYSYSKRAGKTLTWYNTKDNTGQFNMNNVTYYYIAIG